MKMEKIEVFIGVRVPIEIKQAIKEAISKGYYLNQSDLIREAIREKLEKIKAK